MSNYTYRISAGGTAGTANAGFTTINAAVADFAANNRCGAGINTIGASDVLTFKISGFLDFAGAGQAVSGITVTAGGQVIVEAYDNPFNASASNALGYSESFDGFKHNATERFLINQANFLIRNLVIATALGGGYGAVEATGAAGAYGRIENCILYNSGVSSFYTSTAWLTYTNLRNCVCITKGDNSAGALRSLKVETDITIEQCVIVNLASAAAGAYGIYQNAGTDITVKNTYVGGFGNFGLSTWDGTCVGNAADTTDTPENNTALESIALSTTNFENVTAGTENLKVKTASALKTTGATRLAAVLADIFGTSRSDPTTIGAFAAEAGAVQALAGAAQGAATATGDLTVSAAAGTLTFPTLKNNAGTVLANETGATVHVYALAGGLVVTKTGQTTNASGVMAVTDAAIVPGTTYRAIIVLASAAEGLAKLAAA